LNATAARNGGDGDANVGKGRRGAVVKRPGDADISPGML
jgi:hypothetical protein